MMFSSFSENTGMMLRNLHEKKRFLIGISLFCCGLLLMFVPQLFHLQSHHTASHAIIVLDATGVLLSYGVFGSNRKS